MARPKKRGERYPCGRLKPNQGNEADSAAYRNRKTAASNPRAYGTVQAMMWIHEKITEQQFEAADWYLQECVRYRRAIGSPETPREPRSGVLGYVDAETVEKRVRGQIRRFMRLYENFTNGQKTALNRLEAQFYDVATLPDLRDALTIIHRYRQGRQRKAA